MARKSIKLKPTRAELNEQAWERKKKQTKGHSRGSRANPNVVEAHAKQQATNDNGNVTSTTQPKVVRAIPLYIPGREQPLVSPKLADTVVTAPASTDNHAEDAKVPVVDLVVGKNGQLVTAAELQQQAKQKARIARRAAAKAQAQEHGTKAKSKTTAKKADFDQAGSVKLGKAALRRLEREQVAPGEESAFFADQVKAKKVKAFKSASEAITPAAPKDSRDRNRALTRDYKAGRNTDYVASQASAEKALRKTKATKAKASGEELLELWESLK